MNVTKSGPHADPADPAPGERIAVIAIHGVADQKPGETARAIASLMVHAGGADARYGKGDCDSFILAVTPLSPLVPSRPPERDNERLEFESNGNGSQTARVVQGPPMPRVEKALRQSMRSDFQRRNWITTRKQSVLPDVPSEELERLGVQLPPSPMPADPGIAFSDYLLFKAERDGTEDEAYEATRIRMTRSSEEGEPVRQVDVHEMYWADLSRLSGALPRIVTELFTMVFRLSRLGRDTVDEAARAARSQSGKRPGATLAWNGLVAVQIALDWAFSTLLANLFLQLLLAGLVIFGLGVAQPHAETVRMVIAWTAPALGAWWLCYRHVRGAAGCAGVVIAAFAAVWVLHSLPAHWVVGLSWLGLLALLCDYGLRVANERFPATRAAGLVFLAATAAILVAHVIADVVTGSGPGGLDNWLRAGMRAVEYLLLAIVAWWSVAAALLVVWLVAGQLASRDDAAARASVATGRLGLFVSIAAFVVLSMALWALLTRMVEIGAAQTSYSPLVFHTVCPDHREVDGACFLHQRYEKSTEAFALVAGLSLTLVAYLIAVFVPSVLAEVKATVGTPQTLGRWLSAGYRRLDGFLTLLVAISVVLACAVGLILLLARFDALPGGWIGALSENVGKLSNQVLKPMVFGAATAGAALSAFGGVLSRYAPWLRSPLDVALDVDNHFREFPRRAIPRARIFSRYVALLEHVAAQGYDRIVVVAHSQGTVITSELLRYLQHRAHHQASVGESDRVTRLWERLQGRVDLLTAGCPLRQLYAARFPHLYAWVLKARKGRSGPRASDIGVGRWINVYTTGDYVGRWLWCDAPPAVETVDGRPTLYDPCTTAVPRAAREVDVCLGIGAHTHYFEQTQKRVAACIDELVSGEAAQVLTQGVAGAEER